MEREIAPRITIDPEKCGGRPCIKGMRIRVSDVIDLLAHGLSVSEVVEELPDLDSEDVLACLRFASRLTTLVYNIPETSLLSEVALSDWNRPEEDEAWASLHPVMKDFPEGTEYDDDLSPEDIAAIEEGIEDIRAGRLTSIEDVRRELGL